VINSSDDNFVPHRIVVMGGSSGNLQKLNDITVDKSVYSVFPFHVTAVVRNVWYLIASHSFWSNLVGFIELLQFISCA